MEITETPNHKLILGVPSETHPQERMVSLVPQNIIPLKEIGVEVLIEHDAGINAGFTDKQYEEVGGTIVPQRSDIFDSANMIAQVRGPSKNPIMICSLLNLAMSFCPESGFLLGPLT